MTTTRDRKIPLLIGGIVVTSGLLLTSIGATAVVVGHAKMGVFEDGPTRIEMRHRPERSMERSDRSETSERAERSEQLRRLMEGFMNQRRTPGESEAPDPQD